MHKKNIKELIKKTNTQIFVTYVAAGIIVLIGVIWFGWLLLNHESATEFIEEIKQVTEENKDECDTRRSFDGVCMDVKNYDDRLIAVMIENHTEARPQSGLADAAIVYEAPVEANFTRFMALFPHNTDVNKIGPVRSARPYYLDWLAEYGDPMYMHVGGSPDALGIIKEREIFDVNEFSRGWYFWRDDARYAPHNAYTSDLLFQSAWEKYGEESESMATSSWTYSDDISCDEECVEEIKVTFALPSYVTRWKYNTSTTQFERYQTEGRHKDQNGIEINADTVIIQSVDSRVIDAIGRKKIRTIGVGEALVFTKGKVTKGTWQKKGIYDKTEWLDLEGNSIPLKPGKIWIEVVGQDSEYEFTNSK